MKPIIVSRTGKPDFALQGKELGRVSSQRTATTQEKFDRWHELSLFETKDEFFAYVLYCSTWPSEKMQHPDLVRAPSLFLLFESLVAYDPSQHCLLRPERTEEEKRQNSKRNFSTRQEIIAGFRSLIQEAARKIEYQDTPENTPRPDETLVRLWMPNELREAIDQKRGDLSFSEAMLFALKQWSLSK